MVIGSLRSLSVAASPRHWSMERRRHAPNAPNDINDLNAPNDPNACLWGRTSKQVAVFPEP